MISDDYQFLMIISKQNSNVWNTICKYLHASTIIIITMAYKYQSEKQSHLASNLTQLRKKGISRGSYNIFIKRQSTLFSSWKSYTMALVESPHQQLMATLHKSGSQAIQKVVNMTYTKFSKKIVQVDNRYCFGIVLPSEKKYYISGENQAKTNEIYNTLRNIREEIKGKNEIEVPSSGQKNYQEIIEEEDNRLQYQKCESEGDKYFSTNAQTPKKESQLYHRIGKIDRVEEIEFDRQSFHTAMLDEEREVPVQQVSLHLNKAISEEEIGVLGCDEGLKLLYNFNGGRYLVKGRQIIKANILLSTGLDCKQLLQTFFRLQLWNQRVKSYKLINRIDKGIYLVKLQIHRRNIFSLPRYCYLMVTTLKIEGQYLVVFRSLEEAQFDKEPGCSWMKMNIWVGARGQKEDNQKLMTVCASFQNEKDFEVGMSLLEQTKTYQIFLKTHGHLQHHTLQWNQDVPIQQQ